MVSGNQLWLKSVREEGVTHFKISNYNTKVNFYELKFKKFFNLPNILFKINSAKNK